MEFLKELYLSWEAEIIEVFEWHHGTLSELFEFIDFYPFVLSLMWSFYALQGLIKERVSARKQKAQDRGSGLPGYSVLVPFYSEIDAAVRSAASLQNVTPPPEEIILIDDGTPPEKLHTVPDLPPSTRIIRLPENRGKAGALNSVLHTVRSEVIVCMDADTTASSTDWTSMLSMFHDRKTGAVTGRIQPRTSGLLVQLMQALDYLAVICFIKKAESQWHALMTVSGAWAAFRRSAVQSCGGWREDVSAEDIDISWKIQARGWVVDYNSDWVSNVEMAPTWRSLWRQRRRWSSGLGRTLRENVGKAFAPSATNTAVAFITLFTNTWISLFILAGLLRIVSGILGKFHVIQLEFFFFAGNWPLYWLTCFAVFMVQFTIAAIIDRRGWRSCLRLIPVIPLYPLYFFLIILTSYLAGFPKGLTRKDSGRWMRTVRSSESEGGSA